MASAGSGAAAAAAPPALNRLTHMGRRVQAALLVSRPPLLYPENKTVNEYR